MKNSLYYRINEKCSLPQYILAPIAVCSVNPNDQSLSSVYGQFMN